MKLYETIAMWVALFYTANIAVTPFWESLRLPPEQGVGGSNPLERAIYK